ncbi:hypothetical protein, partial [Succinimonas sp.]|uniref:hypothetical protein n=1 Tax=Succinimonas sp. TaxID=1936151 RepID=UPI00386C7270
FFLKFQNLILLPARNFSFSSAVSSSNRGFRQVPSFSASRHLHHIPLSGPARESAFLTKRLSDKGRIRTGNPDLIPIEELLLALLMVKV